MRYDVKREKDTVMTTQKSQDPSATVIQPDATATQGGEDAGSPAMSHASGASDVKSLVVPSTAVAAIQAFVSVFDPAVKALRAELPEEVRGSGRHNPRLRPSRRRAVSLLTAMLRRYPSLSATIRPEDLDAGMSVAAAADSLISRLAGATGLANSTSRMRHRDVWRACGEIMVVAERRAETDVNIARDLAEIQDLLSIGKKRDNAPVTAMTAQQDVTKAQERLTRAHQRPAKKAAAAAAVAAQDGVADGTSGQGTKGGTGGG